MPVYRTASEEETIALGARLAREWPRRAAVLLIGQLGAGKTTLAKGIVKGLGAADPDEVASPTFTLIHEYGEGPRVYHIDLYRLEHAREAAALGLDDIFEREAVVLVEWGERFPELMPPGRIEIRIEVGAWRGTRDPRGTDYMTKRNWALILGASSGFGEAAALRLAGAGMHIFGVHLDRRETLPHVEQVQERIRALGCEAVFFNANAADEARRAEMIAALRGHLTSEDAPGTCRVLLHSLAFGALRPLVSTEDQASRRNLELTVDIMGHSLVYWVQDLVGQGLMESGGRVFAMTSEGGLKAIPNYGPVSAAKAVLEAHIRQLALELAPRGITANAILAGVTETPALRQIPGHETLIQYALARNPHHRLTTPDDVARAIALLSHEDSYWITGNTIRVDGGEVTAA